MCARILLCEHTDTYWLRARRSVQCDGSKKPRLGCNRERGLNQHAGLSRNADVQSHYRLPCGKGQPEMDILGGAQDQRATKGAYSMARRRWQEGSVYLRKSKTRPDAWWGRYFEPVIAEDGTLKRVQRNKRLGVRGRNDGQLTKRLAERELRPYVDAANNYQPTAARPQVSRKAATLFSEFAAVWLEKGLVHRKASTKYGMRCHIKAHLIPAFGRIPMGDLESERVQSFVNELAERRSPKTVKAVLTTLRVMWKSAVAWKYVEDELFVKRPKVKDVEMRCYSAEEVRRILTNAVGEDRTLLWLLAETGMRAGEVTALAANAIDLDNRVVEVRIKLDKEESKKLTRFTELQVQVNIEA